MHRTSRRVRAVAPLALAALILGMPAAAVAKTVPAPVPTPSSSSTPTAQASASSGPATLTPESSSATPTATPSVTGSTTTSPEPEGTASPSTPSKAGSSATSSPTDAPEPVPFGVRTARRSLVAGTPSEQATFAGGYLTRTLAERGNHYTWPGGDFFDGGNTIDAILGLDGAKVGSSGADAAFAYLEDHVGGYIGTDLDSLYAGPAAKALLAVVAHGGEPSSFGGLDLVSALVDDSLGAVEPGRFSDLPVDCGYATCDYSNTIGQSLALIAVGRATGEVPGEAVDYLLDQQCADGGFRGSLAVAGGACASDLDATAFAAQALVGLGADDEAEAALQFLAGKQQVSGGLVNGDGAVNANTTGLAAQAFAAAGWSQELASAQGFLAGLQLDCGFAATVRGGIAFTAADRATLRSNPTDTAAVDKLLRSTPQATLGLAGGNLLDVTDEGATASAPTVACTTPTATPTTPGSSTPAPTSSTGGTGTHGPGSSDGPAGADGSGAADGSEQSGAEAAGPGLAYTGASPLLPLTIAVLLLLAGAATILVSRRRGAHL